VNVKACTAEYFVRLDDIFLPSDEASRSESDDFDREIEEFKRFGFISHQLAPCCDDN